MRTIERVHDLRDLCDRARAAGGRVGFVPTMGYFHAGHRSLMRAARADTDLVVVSLFVNPLQFAPNEDLAAYPRDRAGDAAAAEAEGVDILFAPTTDEVYPRPPVTTVRVEGLTAGLCGRSRPTHFDGVTTVVAKLFSMVGPSRAYFGRKDAQQAVVIERMARDLDFPVRVEVLPTVRGADGVALSSRNSYLDAGERERATAISRALRTAERAVADGERSTAALTERIAAELREAGIEPEYVEARDAGDLTPVSELNGRPVLVAVAAPVGRARLIDNVVVTQPETETK